MKSNDYILTNIYPLVERQYKKNSNKVKECFGRFVQKRQESLYDIAPYNRMYFGQDDINDFFNSIGIDPKEVKEGTKDCYFMEIEKFNPSCIKDSFVQCMMCLIRYTHLHRLTKEMDNYTAYLLFSGLFYTSIHYGSFNYEPKREVMEYVVNNKLSGRFDIKRSQNLFNAVKNIGLTWHSTYNDKFKNFDDEDVVYLTQQLRNRLSSFIHNIAEVYYEAYRNEEYLNYESDNLSDEDFHLADNDTMKMERILEKTMNKITGSNIDYKICMSCSDSNVKFDEVKNLLRIILSNNENIPQIREVIRDILVSYFAESKTKDVRNQDFLVSAIPLRPNSKDKYYIDKMRIIESWLTENSERYRKRRKRLDTQSSYKKSINSYLVLMIQKANI